MKGAASYDFVAFVFAIGCVWLFSLTAAYIVGMDRQAKLALSGYNEGVRSSLILEVCVATQARTMHLVLIEDAYLHQKIRELPPIALRKADR